LPELAEQVLPCKRKKWESILSSWLAVHLDVNAKYLHTWEATSQHMKRDLSSILDYVLLLRGAKQTIRTEDFSCLEIRCSLLKNPSMDETEPEQAFAHAQMQ
jgi:hypothetical protein